MASASYDAIFRMPLELPHGDVCIGARNSCFILTVVDAQSQARVLRGDGRRDGLSGEASARVSSVLSRLPGLCAVLRVGSVDSPGVGEFAIFIGPSGETGTCLFRALWPTHQTASLFEVKRNSRARMAGRTIDVDDSPEPTTTGALMASTFCRSRIGPSLNRKLVTG
jgi:hypothetical protein